MHLGHRRVIEEALATGLPVRALTFHPHPRVVLGNFVELITTLERRLELLAELGVAETTVLDFTLERRAAGAGGVRGDAPRAARASSSPAPTSASAGGGAATSTCSSGSATRCAPCRCSRASPRPRSGGTLHAGEVEEAARLLGRPPELDGVVVPGDQRGGTLGYPTANLAVDPTLLVPRYGIYAGAATRTTGRRSRSARTPTTAARSAGSSRTCSTSRATSTAGGWSSSSGSGCATSRSSRASRS